MNKIKKCVELEMEIDYWRVLIPLIGHFIVRNL